MTSARLVVMHLNVCERVCAFGYLLCWLQPTTIVCTRTSQTPCVCDDCAATTATIATIATTATTSNYPPLLASRRRCVRRLWLWLFVILSASIHRLAVRVAGGGNAQRRKRTEPIQRQCTAQCTTHWYYIHTERSLDVSMGILCADSDGWMDTSAHIHVLYENV